MIKDAFDMQCTLYSIIHRDNQTAFITKNAVKCNVSAIATAGIA